MSVGVDLLDQPEYGARKLAEIANVIDEHGNPDLRRFYYMVERGYLDVDRVGRILTSTRRRLLKRHLPAP